MDILKTEVNSGFKKPNKIIRISRTKCPLIQGINQPDWSMYLPINKDQKFIFDTEACFPYDTEVLMEDLTRKRISEIKVGEYVISHTGKKRKVIETFKREYKYKSPFYRLEIMGLCDPIICTPNHPFLTKSGWKQAQLLTINDSVCIPSLNKFYKDVTIKEIEKDKDFLWLLGLYLAEGSLGKENKPKNNDIKLKLKLKVNGTGSGRGTITFSLHKNEIEFANKINNISKNLFDTKFNIIYKSKSNGIDVKGYNVNLRDSLNELGGQYCDQKTINSRILLLEPKLQLEIVKGWLDGDGHFNKNIKKIIGTTTSKKLIEQIQLILLRNKIKSSVYKNSAKGIHKEYYQIGIYGTEINKLYDWEIESKKNKQKEYFDENFLHRKIVKIEQIQSKSSKIHVYNLEIEEDHSYIVNSVAVHNCMTFSSTNIIETILESMRDKGQIPKNVLDKCSRLGYFDNMGKFDFSDRFSAIMNGTDPHSGNSFDPVWKGHQKFGLLPDSDFSYTKQQAQAFSTPEAFWADYYNGSLITQAMKDKALQFNQMFKIDYAWIIASGFNGFSSIWDVVTGKTHLGILQDQISNGPIQLAIPACMGWNSGNVPVCNINEAQHGVELFRVNPDGSYAIFDQYSPYQKTLQNGYNIPYAVLPSIKIIQKPVCTFNSNLAFGDKNNDILNLQRCLAYLGYFTMEPTAYFGPVTAGAVMAFQRDYNIATPEVIGELAGHNVGPLTRSALNRLFMV